MENNTVQTEQVQQTTVTTEAAAPAPPVPPLETPTLNAPLSNTQPLPVETLEVPTHKEPVSCSSCNSVGIGSATMLSFALLVPLFIKYFKRI